MHQESVSSCGNYSILKSDSDLEIHTTPLIIIGGWAGAQDKVLRKYAEFLADHGYSSIRSVLPLFALFAPIAYPRRQWAIGALDYLREHGMFPSR